MNGEKVEEKSKITVFFFSFFFVLNPDLVHLGANGRKISNRRWRWGGRRLPAGLLGNQHKKVQNCVRVGGT